MEELHDEDVTVYKVPVVASVLPLERSELMLAWKASFDKELNSSVKVWIFLAPLLEIKRILKLWFFLLIKTTF